MSDRPADRPVPRLARASARKRAARVRAQWAAARAATSVRVGDGAAWLEGKAAEGFACDAAITPVVTGEVNPAVLEDLIRLCTELAGHGPGRCAPVENDILGRGTGPVPPTERSREALEKAIIGKTTILLLHSWSALDVR